MQHHNSADQFSIRASCTRLSLRAVIMEGVLSRALCWCCRSFFPSANHGRPPCSSALPLLARPACPFVCSTSPFVLEPVTNKGWGRLIQRTGMSYNFVAVSTSPDTLYVTAALFLRTQLVTYKGSDPITNSVSV
jgi:hypothetical protein